MKRAPRLRFDAEVVVHGSLNPLLAAEIPFCCLHGNVAQKELNLLQFAACGMAQLCARAAKIMWSEPRKTEFLRALFHDVPDHPLRYSITPMLACSTDASKQPSCRNPGRHDPQIQGRLDPAGHRYGPDVSAFCLRRWTIAQWSSRRCMWVNSRSANSRRLRPQPSRMARIARSRLPLSVSGSGAARACGPRQW